MPNTLEDILKDCFILRDLPAEQHYAFITGHLIEPLKALKSGDVTAERFKTSLEQIQTMAAEDLRVDRVFVCHSFLSQIEATAHAALSATESN
jgi:hypothetical protein